MIDPEDKRKLEELLATVDALDDSDEERFRPGPFREMLERGRPLSDKQRAWLNDTHERVCGEPAYENLISSGKAPRGREVELLVKDRPLRPPTKVTRDG